MFSKLFGKRKPAATSVFAQINMRLMPIARGDLLEDPLHEVLTKRGLGEVTGAGTQQGEEGEIQFCGIDIEVTNLDAAIPLIAETLNRQGVAKGSRLTYEQNGHKMEALFGVAEGLAIYLNGTDLAPKVYQQNDINRVIDALSAAVGESGTLLNHWEGPRETALYYYGPSFAEMSRLMQPVLASSPACERSRVVQIA